MMIRENRFDSFLTIQLHSSSFYFLRRSSFMNFGTAGNQYGPTVYGFALHNPTSIVDKTMLSCSMWKSSIKLAISPAIEGDSYTVRYDRANSVSIYLTAPKAHMLACLLRDYLQDRDKYNCKGIPSANKLVTIQKGYDLVRNNDEEVKQSAGDVLMIRQLSQEGTIESSYAYEFRRTAYGFIEKFDAQTGKFDQNFKRHENLDMEQLIMQLEQYYMAMTNAVAFTVADTLYPCIEKIANKLGVDLAGGNYGGGYRNNSYFNPNNSSSNGTVSNSYVQQSPNNQYAAGGLEGLMRS